MVPVGTEMRESSSNLKIKNVILREYNPRLNISKSEGLEILHRKLENGESNTSLMGTPTQIHKYLQNKNIVSERLRTLRTVPKYREICGKKVEIY